MCRWAIGDFSDRMAMGTWNMEYTIVNRLNMGFKYEI
jgi:hypothetical protein